MRIDRKLNLVLPLERADGTIYVHATPISREVFEASFLLVSKTFAEIYTQGLNSTVGPRVAAMLLAKIAADMGAPEAAAGLMNEIRRLANVIAPGPQGWTTLPLQSALTEGLIGDDDAAEVENAIVFFTVASAIHRKAVLKPILQGAAELWGGQIESLNCTEYANGLSTSMPGANTGETAKPSSIPS